MLFETEPTALQQAFLEQGIRLADYRRPLPASPAERAKHLSLLDLAYKRLAQIPHVQQHLAATGGASGPLSLTESSRSEKRKKGWNEQRRQPAEEVKNVETRAATRKLREPYRRAIDLHLLQGHTYPQMAQELGLPIGTVKSHVSRGMNLLQRLGA